MFCRKASCAVLGACLGVMPGAMAEDHVVPRTELHAKIAAASETRRMHLAQTEKFLALEPVQETLRRLKIDRTQLQKSAALLSDDELARLAARADQARADIAAGALSNQELTYIVIALAAAVLVLVIVVA